MRPVKTDLGVAACLVENGKILLVKEGKGVQKNLWGLPKGSVDEGELPQSALKRELREECGISVEVLGLIGLRECLIEQVPAVFLAYLVNTENCEINIDYDEISEYGWFGLNEISDLNWISQAMTHLAEKALTNHPGKMIDFSKERKREYFLYL
tara:strand:+ start:21486 stop:21947 length:462 start_codon:yes stop_codon:yes gene_type:complete